MRFFLILICFLSISSDFIGQNKNPFDAKNKRIPKTESSRNINDFHLKQIPGLSSKPALSSGGYKSVPLSKSLAFPKPEHKDLEISKSNVNATPHFIRGRINGLRNPTARQSKDALYFNYLEDVKGIIQIEAPRDEFQIKEIISDKLGMTHARMQQKYKGLDVYGAEIIVHTKNNEVIALNGRYLATPILDNILPTLRVSDAEELTKIDLSQTRKFQDFNEVESIQEYQNYLSELIVYKDDENKEILAYHITVRPNILERWEYFIDAISGEIVNKYDHTCAIDGPRTAIATDLNGVNRQVNTYEFGTTFFMLDASRSMFNSGQSVLPNDPVGGIITVDLKNESPQGNNTSVFHVTSSTNNWTDESSVSAQHNAGVAYDYYLNTFGRNSIDGRGGSVFSYVNVGDEDGGSLENAFWNGIAMFYGNGGTAFKPLAGSADVAGHEITHGVVSNTANLEYKNQSGAINESMADIFGVMIDRDDWLLGEDVVKTNVFPSGALRSMQDPHNGGNSLNDNGYQPRHMSEIYTGTQDNGGVHINSGIVNYAFFLFASDANVGKSKAEQVYYRALTSYLTRNSKFSDLRLAVVASATDLHGASSAEVTAAKNAFDGVGIFNNTDTGGGGPIEEAPVIEGDDFILAYNVDPSTVNTLHIYSTTGSELAPISNTSVFRKPSITDDGSTALFITDEKHITAIELFGSFTENVLSAEGVWDNVAISKDGNKVAAVTNVVDGLIYVFDLINGTQKEFKLFNPTFTEGITTGEVLYADAIEWDFSGQYLVYDAYNVVKNDVGTDVDYWDVGFINVWDNVNKTYANGNIQKLFSSLPDGLSIGNPSFSKNSPNIIAFDAFSDVDGTYDILAVNIETGVTKEVFANLQLGFPNYSKLDDKIIFDALDGSNNEVIGVIPLNSDKITVAGDATLLIPSARWATWFTQGTRTVLKSGNDILTFKFNDFSVPLVGSVAGSTILVVVPDETNITNLIATFTHSAASLVKVGDFTQLSGLISNDFTNNVVYRVIAEDGSTKEYTVTVRLESEVITGINEANVLAPNLYPNPFRNELVISYPNEELDNAQLKIINQMGQLLLSTDLKNSLEKGMYKVQLNDLPMGTYIAILRVGDNIYRRSIIKVAD